MSVAVATDWGLVLAPPATLCTSAVPPRLPSLPFHLLLESKTPSALCPKKRSTSDWTPSAEEEPRVEPRALQNWLGKGICLKFALLCTGSCVPPSSYEGFSPEK